MATESRSSFRTGPFVVDPFHFEIRSGERRVSLEPMVMSVLVRLLERNGEVVSKRELLRDVWGGRFVSDDVVAAAIYQIRRAFGDRASEPVYLETVHRRGYRWRAPVDRMSPTRRRFWPAVAVAAAVAGAVLVAGVVRQSPQRSIDVDVGARSAYAKGRYFLDRRTPKSTRQALEAFEEAVAVAPEWAAAHAGIADAHLLRLDLGIASRADVEEVSRRHVMRAFELDRMSPEAWTSLGLTRLFLDFDASSASEAFDEAVALGAESSFAHQAHAWLLSSQGRLQQAIDAAERASELAPTAISPHLDRAFMLGLAGRHDEAIAAVGQALELDDGRPAALASLGRLLLLVGREQEALDAFARFFELTGSGDPTELSQRVARDGVEGLYRYQLAAFGPRMGWTARARMYAALGEAETALDCLERAFREGDTAVLWVKSDPLFRRLEDEPRFGALLSKL